MTKQIAWPNSSSFSSEQFAAEPGYCAARGLADLIESAYGFKTYPINILREGKLAAFAAVTHIQHPIFGSYLVSAPYSSYGGVWFSDSDALSELSDELESLTHELKAEYSVLRFRGNAADPALGWIASDLYRTFRLDLSSDAETHLNSFSSNHRNHIRRSLKKGFTLRVGGIELIEGAYTGLSRSMRELGSPYHAKSYLSGMLASLPNAVDLAVVYKGDTIVGAGVFIRWQNEVINLHANILRAHRSLYAGEFFYWSIIEHYRAKGLRVFDLGRSLIGSGNEAFKSKWEPEIIPLNYWYFLPNGGSIPELNQKSPKFQIAIAVWKHLPQFIVDILGPFLIKGIA